MSKTPARKHQLELPVLVTLSGTPSQARGTDVGRDDNAPAKSTKLPAQASAQDEAIYRAISDNYFRDLE
ncbi:hypothetical protein [Burkholderia pseudomallei]|uniref:hypothetical protein n=1 Tax=Burkholderia pseudomallei TaxID=28450 RepID=UPI000F221313|nr:hypothetical protein [Burkholderia pseudomallei]CAJ4292653.1 Uncharacterised protein [Burkholderia pseudomallei]CAJ6201047.1 Uncharacterised protein [Burkholderia pseudomallei]CAJ7161868.1 Uncharacterised protein [Burkholderia pseudomallei]CAJ7893283.1 Uncharacterised protein [Burkholderia pseudomallei]VBF60600.1 Uncharacterised protein [Burkholderia pseudomallei]